MKTILALASVTMLNVCAVAQPVINSHNISQNFNADLYFADLPAGFNPGPAGPNQTWNFSSIGEGMLLGTQAAVPFASSPYADEFPEANYVHTMNSVFSDETVYFYHKLTPTVFEIYTLGYGGEIGENFEQDPRTYLVFPYTYNTVFTDTYQRTGEAPLSVTAIYDAYGTLIMPFGTFHNVVRQKVTAEGSTDYVWFNVNPFYPILQTALADEALGFVIDHTVLGIGDHDAASIVAYPNPVSDVVNIRIPASVSAADVSVTDLSGKKLIAGKFSSADISVDMAELSAGIYFITVGTVEGQYTKKIVKS